MKQFHVRLLRNNETSVVDTVYPQFLAIASPPFCYTWVWPIQTKLKLMGAILSYCGVE